jgi:hypothetical protein
VKNTVCGNRGLTIQEVAEEVGISTGLGMHRVSEKRVPRLLTDDQKLQQFSICGNLLQRANDDDNLLKNVITGDEM